MGVCSGGKGGYLRPALGARGTWRGGDSRPSVLGSDSLAPPSTTKRPRGLPTPLGEWQIGGRTGDLSEVPWHLCQAPSLHHSL